MECEALRVSCSASARKIPLRRTGDEVHSVYIDAKEFIMSRRLLFSVCFLSLAACAHAPKEPIAQAAQPEKTRPTTRFPASVFASRTKKPNLPLPQVVSDREYAIDAKSCHCTYKNLKTGAIATPSCDDNKLGVAKTITLSRREKMLWVDTCVVENGKPNASWSSKED
jgi:hypothetical protein